VEADDIPVINYNVNMASYGGQNKKIDRSQPLPFDRLVTTAGELSALVPIP
jgi:hypothetical protein